MVELLKGNYDSVIGEIFCFENSGKISWRSKRNSSIYPKLFLKKYGKSFYCLVAAWKLYWKRKGIAYKTKRELNGHVVNFIKQDTTTPVFSCKFWKVFQNKFLTEHLWGLPLKLCERKSLLLSVRLCFLH